MSKKRLRFFKSTKLTYLLILLILFYFSSHAALYNKPERIELIKEKLQQVIIHSEGWIAVSFEAPDQRLHFGINDSISVHAASTMKIAVMCQVFKMVESERLYLDQNVLIQNTFSSIVDSSHYSLELADDSSDDLYAKVGQKMTLKDLVQDMITVSGNLSTNLLIEIVSASNIQNLMKSIDASELNVLRGVEDIKAYRAGLNNTTTARALTRVLRAIYLNQICAKPYSDQMIQILLNQKFNDALPALLPGHVRIAHKTGSITAINHDAGIIYPPDQSAYILSVLTRGFDNPQAAKRKIAEISKMIYDWYVETPVH